MFTVNMDVKRVQIMDLANVNKMYEFVINSLWEEVEINNFSAFINKVEEVYEHGIASGVVGSMIYCSDVVDFYDDFKHEINELLSEFLDSMGGYPLDKLFKDWDSDDMLALTPWNQSILAYFGFEQVVCQLKILLEKQY